MANLRLQSADLMAISRAMDTNGNNRIDNNEANISGSAQRQIGNANGVVGTREFANALESGDIFLSGLNPATADKVAEYFSKRNDNFDRPVAQWVTDAWVSKSDFEFNPEAKRAIDTNGDNKVSRKELAQALTSGTVTIGQQRQVQNDPFRQPPAQNDPFQNRDPFKQPAQRDPFQNRDPFKQPAQRDPFQNNDPFQDRQRGVGLEQAQDFARSLHNIKMQTNMFGEYVAGSGSLRPSEANAEIKEFIQERVIQSRGMELGDKLRLLENELMQTNMFGEYDLYSGSLKMEEASSMAKQAVEFEIEYGRGTDPRNIISMIEDKTVELNMFGEEVPGSGLIRYNDGRSLVKNFIEDVVVTTPRLSLDQKLNIIKSQQMAQNMFGEYDQTSGTLTVDEASRLSRMALDY